MRIEKLIAADKKLWSERMRAQGYADGYAGKEAGSVEADYQAAWRDGRAARRKEQEA